MRTWVSSIAMAGILLSLSLGSSFAAPIEGFDVQYNAVFEACTIPTGGLPAGDAELSDAINAALVGCEEAINTYSGALVTTVDLSAANESFTALRAEVYTANEPSPPFRAAIDALFEQLLPDSGAVPDVPAAPGSVAPLTVDGDDDDGSPSPTF